MNDPGLSQYAVLYTDDMEPITVLQLSPLARDMLIKRGYVALHVLEPVSLMPEVLPATEVRFRKLVISAEMFYRNDKKHLMLFTGDEETALLLRSAFLPGQQRQARDERSAAFARGFLHALTQLGAA